MLCWNEYHEYFHLMAGNFRWMSDEYKAVPTHINHCCIYMVSNDMPCLQTEKFDKSLSVPLGQIIWLVYKLCLPLLSIFFLKIFHIFKKESDYVCFSYNLSPVLTAALLSARFTDLMKFCPFEEWSTGASRELPKEQPKNATKRTNSVSY